MSLYEVGKAQKMVLEALGRGDIQTHQGANDFFARVGIIVTPVRQGRTSVPSIKRRPDVEGGFNAWGEGESSEITYEPIDFSKIAQWMVQAEKEKK